LLCKKENSLLSLYILISKFIRTFQGTLLDFLENGNLPVTLPLHLLPWEQHILIKLKDLVFHSPYIISSQPLTAQYSIFLIFVSGFPTLSLELFPESHLSK